MATNRRRDFETFQAFVDYADGAPREGGSSDTQGPYQAEWTGTPSRDAAVSLARTGWVDGLARIKPLTASLIATLTETITRDDWSWCDDATRGAVDVLAAYQGIPECVLAPVQVEDTSAKRTVRVVMSGSTSGAIGVDVLTARGSMVAALVELLSYAGLAVRVEVTFCSRAHGTGNTNELRVCVKDYGDALDMERLVYALAHPSTLRRLAFAAWEREPASVRKAHDFYKDEGYGSPQDVADRGDLYIAKQSWDGERGGWDVDRAQKWVVKNLKDCGVVVTEPQG